jgi:beta-glucanase (GH16 family)
MFLMILLSTLVNASCGGGKENTVTPPPTPITTQTATPTITTAAAQSGAQIVILNDATAGAVLRYTLDGSTPTANSPRYFAPFLGASNLTVTSIATHSGNTDSQTISQAFAPNISSGTLVWSDEFFNLTGANAQPDPMVWTYDTGNSGFGNNELENYCAWGSTASPCDPATPNAYVGNGDGNLHIVALHPSNGSYTSARLKSQGLFSFSYGRIEARIQLPEGQGLWPAFWMLGNNISTVNWPACGEQDIMEHINAAAPDWVEASIHGKNLDRGQQIFAASGQTFGGWHIYGMIWSPSSVSYYLDLPTNIYATFTKSNTSGTWPFDTNGGGFIILNLAVGGNWPGSPDGSTQFPSEMLVDYVRIYTN